MNVQMAEQIRLITIKRGHDPRRFTLIAFGGAGPLHAGALISMLGMESCLIPPTPGVLSAYGLLNADLEVEGAESYLKHVDEVVPADLASTLEALQARCVAIMRRDGLGTDRVKARYAADVRYTGQSYEIPVTFRANRIDASTLPNLVRDFEALYLNMYGHTNRSPVEIVNLRCVAYEPVKPLEGLSIRTPGGAGNKGESSREVWFLGLDKPSRVPVVQRESLRERATVEGPAIIEQADTTILVYPHQRGVVDAANNIRISGVSEAYTL
jgi:N-methylhydantoinase A